MTFSPWMPVQAAGYSGAAPYAVFTSGFRRYAATWQRPEWRYDRATGYVEYRGLVAKDDAATGNFHPMILTYLAESPGLPKPTKACLLRGMSNAADRLWGQPFRMDIHPYAGAHHCVTISAGSPGIAAGAWFWLQIEQSFSDSDPLWFPWRAVGVNADGVQATFGSGYAPYSTTDWMHDFRFTRDYKRWQWRALLKGPAMGSAPPYDNIVTVSHPNPQTLGNCLNQCLINYDWAGGSTQGIRVDNRQHAGGHRLDIVTGAAGRVPGFLGVILDYCTRL